MHNCCQTHLTLLILDPSFVGRCLLKDEPIFFSLTGFYFHSTLFREKNIRRNLSQYFRFAVKMNCKREQLWLVLITHLRGLLFVIFRRIKCNEEIHIFIKHIKSWNFLHFYRYFCSMLPRESQFNAKCLFMIFNRKIIWVVHSLFAPEGNFGVKTLVLVSWLLNDK